MADIVNTPGNGTGNNAGWIIAVVLILFLLLVAFFVFGDNDADDARDTVQDQPAQVENTANDNSVPPPIINNTFNSTTTITNSTTTED